MLRHENHEGDKWADPKDRSVTCKIKDGEEEGTDGEEAMIKHIVEEIVTDMKKRCSLIKEAGF